MKVASKKKARTKVVAKKKSVAKKKATARASSGKRTHKADKARQKANVPDDNTIQERVLRLRSVMAINEANTIHAGLLRFISDDTDIVIDASAVEMIDTSILQLIVAFVKEVHKKQCNVTWKDPSDEFCARAALLGLDHELGIEEVCG